MIMHQFAVWSKSSLSKTKPKNSITFTRQEGGDLPPATPKCLDFTPKVLRFRNIERIGLYCIRATAAMAMYLSNVPVFTIMLFSVAGAASLSCATTFGQVEQLTKGVSARMLTVDHFHIVNVSRNQAGIHSKRPVRPPYSLRTCRQRHSSHGQCPTPQSFRHFGVPTDNIKWSLTPR
jgi:hypothetical protein